MSGVLLVVLLLLALIGAVFAARYVRSEFGRLVLDALSGYRAERDEAQLRPSVRVVDIDDATVDLDEERRRRLGHAEHGDLRDFAGDFRDWSAAMWAGRNAKTIARRIRGDQ